MKCWTLVLALAFGSCALAQKPSPVFQGTWTATAGSTQVLRGTWSGQASPKSENVAQGSWTLLNEAGEIFLQGTWSAQKTAQRWQGTWTARSQNGLSFSGAWSADMADSGGNTIRDMLERTMAKEVAGSWRRGHDQGNWWLKGSLPRGRGR